MLHGDLGEQVPRECALSSGDTTGEAEDGHGLW